MVAEVRYWRDVVDSAPPKWPRLPLKDVFRERKETDREDLPLLAITGDQGIIPRDELERRDTSSLDKSKYLRVAPGDLAYNTMRMWQGVSGVSSHEGIVSPAYTVCELRDSHDPDFMGYLCKLPLLVGCFHAYSQGIVSDTLSLRFQQFGEIIVPIPPTTEQQKIAAILSSVDDGIAATRKVIEQTKRVKQGLLQTLMTRGIGHKQFKKTEIGEIPEAWEVVPASQVADGGDAGIVGGPFGSDLTSKDYKNPPGVPVIRGTNLNYGDGTFRLDDFVYVSGEKADQLGRNLAFPGDLIVTQRGTLGQVGLIPTESPFDRYVVSQSQMRLTPDRAKIHPRFLWYYATSRTVLDWIESHTIATGVPHINLGLFRRLPVPAVPLEEQAEILARLDTLQARVDAAVAEAASIRRLRSGLMQDLLTGRVRVNPD